MLHDGGLHSLWRGYQGYGGAGRRQGWAKEYCLFLGGGAGTNVRDILYLRGVDMAILNTDVIDYYKDRPLYEGLTNRIQYITKLFNEEVHLYGSAKVNSLRDIEGKVVGFNNSSAEVTGLVLFEKLGITPSDTIRISEADGALGFERKVALTP